MANVLNVVSKLIQRIFIIKAGAYTIFERLIVVITSRPYLCLGVILLVIGFSISVIKRIIHS